VRVRFPRPSIAAAISVVLVLAPLGQAPAFAAPYKPRGPQAIPSVPVKRVPVKSLPARSGPAAGKPRPVPVWPKAGAADVDLPAAGGMRTAAEQATPPRAGAMPVFVGRQGGGAFTTSSVDELKRVHVELTDRTRSEAAGVPGLILSVRRADGLDAPGRVAVTVDYSAFRAGYGADWAGRLRLVALTGCGDGLSGGCKPVALPSRNDLQAGRVSADVDLAVPPTANQRGRVGASSAAAPSAVVALTAGPASAAGSFSASPLTPSSSWAAGTSSGDFSWSYPLRLPPAPAGTAPKLRFAYSSQSVDGRNAASNNQPSEVGEGFDYAPGFIERRYRTCADDMGGNANNTTKTYDQCWVTDNAVMSLGGHSSELIPDGSGRWHLRNDDGSRVEQLTGAVNGDDNGEYWRVTTPDGIQYWFGRNRLPGWSDGRPETRSTLAVPVFGNNDREPCHQATFAASSCDQAYRWNLDYVVDPHGNSTSLWYSQETNYYARNADSEHSVPYGRASFLEHIDYGTRVTPDVATGADSVFTGVVPARVVFKPDDRCLADCGKHDPEHWKDTPWDQQCLKGAKCYLSSPTFWSTRRMSAVTTQVWDAGQNKLRDVDRWQLRQSFPDPGDGTHAGLWLDGITHTGLTGGAAPLPEVTFDHAQLPNRVDALDNSSAMNWMRIAAIHTESGGMISVNYSKPDCVRGSRMPAAPESNGYRCYPVRWTPEGAAGPIVDWYHKYVVDSVLETDGTGGALATVTQYSYLTDAAWHYADDPLVADADRTWSQWRGYGKIGVTRGYRDEQRSYAEATFFRGMNGDHLPGGGVRTVAVPDSQGGNWPDDEAFTGMTREQVTFNGPGGAEVSGAVNDPWQSVPTATRGAVAARHTGIKATHNRVALDRGRGYQRSTVTSEFDGHGRVTQTEDQGDDTDPGDSRCTRHTYPADTDVWLLDLPVRTEKYALPCGQSPTRAEDVISDVRTYYDGQPYGAAAVRGDQTMVETLKKWAPGDGEYSATSRARFDSSGRNIEKWDAAGKLTRTDYNPATGPVTKVTVTGPLGFGSVTELDPAWGGTTRSVDANGKVTEFSYDPLQRLTEMYQPGHVKGRDTPSARMGYQLRTDGTTWTSVSRLGPNGKYITTYTIFDSLLRQREVQKPSPQGGRIITETLYDSAGRAYLSYGPYHDAGAPGPDLVTPKDAKTVSTQTLTLFDGANRTVASVFKPFDTERWRTTTVYGGDHVEVIPPAGGYARGTGSDARGNTTQVRQYHTNQPGPDVDTTTYRYDPRGYRTEVIDSSGNHWTFGFDVRGRQTTATDPDSGTSEIGYDDADRVAWRTDGRGQKLVYGYDDLGRRKTLSDGAGKLLASWSYDTLAKGYLTASTRYDDGGQPYTVAVRGYSDLYNETGTIVTIPATEGKLAGRYEFQTTYNVDGSPDTVTYPRAGGLEPESVHYTYDDLGESKTLETFYNLTNSTYVTDSAYDSLAQLSQYRFSTGTGNTYQTFTYELDTGRLTDTETSRDSRSPDLITHTHYDFEPAGAITKISDKPASGPVDTQCFTHDYLQRLTEAWTPTSGDCAAAPSADALGGPAPYWKSWTFDPAGNRRTLIEHATPTGDVTTTYAHPDARQVRSHSITGTTTTDRTGTRSHSYGYDLAGNMTSRPGPSGEQTLSWDAEGHLATVTDAKGKSGYIYDAGDRRLLAHDPAGVTLYLPNMELRLDAAKNEVTATRYYTAASGVVCQRTPAGVTWLIPDHHGTGNIAVDAKTQAETRRRLDPYGNPRGGAVAWLNPHGFVDGHIDPTGLTHLGAREYDPGLGAFTSIDPKIDLDAPETLNPYGYSGNNPVTYSDPDGLSWLDGLVKTLTAANNGATWAGIGMMVLGAAADAGGGLLIATGVGAPLGVALGAVGTDVIIAGAAVATAGIAAGCAQNIMNNSSTGSGGGDTPSTSAKQPHPYEQQAQALRNEHKGNAEGGEKLSDVNSYKAVEGGPAEAKPVVEEGAPGGDVKFTDANGNIVLRREVKAVTNQNSFKNQMKRAATEINKDGEVFVQVPEGTSAQTARGWLTQFQRQPGRKIAEYAKMKVRFVDTKGTELGTYNVAEPPPPPRTGSGRIYAI
jgi:RHS repeat-associated protein